MIEALFRFEGRLGRLGFVGWSGAALALVAAILVGSLGLGIGLALLGVPPDGAAARLGFLTAMIAGGVVVWTTLALVSKRLRDIGLAPLPFVIAATLLLLLDYYVLTRLTEVRFFAPFAGYTLFGGLLASGFTIFLLCWPGRPAFGYPDAGDIAMQRLAVGLTVVICLAAGALLAPFVYFVPQRHALVQRALASGWPSVAATLLTPLAAAGDVRALNNLGVLRGLGVGTIKDAGDAARLFARAVDRGSARARVNAIMLPGGRCGLNVARSAATAEALAPVAPSDPAAAGHIQDCLYLEATSGRLLDRDQLATAAATQVQQTADPAFLLQSGTALLMRARTAQRPMTGDLSDDERRHDSVVIPLARKAMELLFAAGEAGAAGAYEPLGILAMQFGDKLGNDPLAVKLREYSNWEWLEVGAEKGDWSAQCRVADAHITELRYRVKTYTREAFDRTVALARGCIGRSEKPQEPLWYRDPEWLVVTPRLPRQTRPTLEIAATEAALNGLLFFDADRKLGGNGQGNAARPKP